ncbi:hypothetical protein B4N89_23880 [Embleya scabrispora]|uniref:Uncharacterized protein n=1 Tax=Embleya scabrispora TaxID=159449 RepID=A0A1T3P3J1_9ACTN|nr:hypothetical protein [Embleya scabrispora]OPC83574.1 hypothetical protein B4N89_23880 [Embleya scabrispora]
MSPIAPRPTVLRQPASTATPRGRRRGLITTVAVAATIALTGSLAACGPKKDEGKASSATVESPKTTGAADTSAAPGAGPAKTEKSDKGDKSEPKGGTDKVAQDLLAYLKTTKHGGVVSEVRIAKQYERYEVTVNTTLPAEPSITEDIKGANARMDKGRKLAVEALQWTQDSATLTISSVSVLDKEKGTAGIENGAEKDGDKAGSEKYAADMLAKLKTTTYGSVVTKVRIAKTYSGYDIAVMTTLPAEVSLTENLTAESARMDKAGKLANEAKQWAQSNTGRKVSSVEVLDVEKGMAGIENVG